MSFHTAIQAPGGHGRPFVRRLAGNPLERLPFLNSSSADHPDGAPSSATPHRVSHTQHPHVTLESHHLNASRSYVATAGPGFHVPYTALPPNSINPNGDATPVSESFTAASTASTARDTFSTTARVADVPWATVVWFPPVSPRMVAAIVAATVVPVVLILVGGLFLLKFLRRQGIARVSGKPATSQQQSPFRGGHWVSDAGRARLPRGIATQSPGLSTRAPLAAAPAAREQKVRSTDSISLRNVPQGVHERHFGDLSFLLDGSEPSEDGGGLGGHGDGTAESGSGWGHDVVATEDLAVQGAWYQIPFSVLGLEKAGQEFTDLNERFGLQV